MKYALPVLVLLFATTPLFGQRAQKRPSGFNQARNQSYVFLEKQWWLGFRAGVNVSDAIVKTRHQVIVPTNYEATSIAKSYRRYADPGFQATLEAAFNFRTLSVSIQPTFRTSRVVYTNTYRWADSDNTSNHLELDYEQTTRLAYVDWPLLVRYEFAVGSVRPYLQTGIYSSLRVDGSNTILVSGVDNASGGDNAFKQEPLEVRASRLYAQHHWGLIVGGGLFYNLGNVRLNLEVLYKKGMSNAASPGNRYRNDRLTGVGDVPDDFHLNSISVSAGCLFPLRFLQSGFKSMID